MDFFETLYRVAFWMLPVMIGGALLVIALTSVIEAFLPRFWIRRVFCPYWERSAAIKLKEPRRFGRSQPLRLVGCSLFRSVSPHCDRGCLAHPANQKTIEACRDGF